MQNFSNDRTVINDTMQDLRDFNSHSLSTQAREGEQLVSMMPAIRKVFDLLGDDIVELCKKNDSLKNKIGCCDEKGLEVSKKNF